MNAVFIMPSNLYGPRDTFDLRTSHVIPALIRRFVEACERGATEVKLWGDGSPTRDFLYVEDAAEAIISAAERYNGAQPVNIGSGQEISIRSVAGKIAALVGFEGMVKWDATQPGGQERRCVDISRAKREFGFHPRTQFDDGLRATIEWYLDTRRGVDADAGLLPTGGAKPH
jgi:GDP-L-fucose synthase